MKKIKPLLLKTFIIFTIVILPIIFLIFYSKDHTFIKQSHPLPISYNKYFKEGYTLLYIGYTGCSTICVPRLTEISTIQRVLQDRNILNLHYLFLDLRDYGEDTSKDFLKAFEGKFNILNLNKNEKNSFLREINFYFSKSLYDNNEYEHNSYLYLLEKKRKGVTIVSTIMQYPFANDTTIDFIEKRVKDGTPQTK